MKDKEMMEAVIQQGTWACARAETTAFTSAYLQCVLEQTNGLSIYKEGYRIGTECAVFLFPLRNNSNCSWSAV